MSRNLRQARLLDLIGKRRIETQEELVEAVQSTGIAATQATISRDIKELGIVKALDEATRVYYYAVSHETDAVTLKMKALFRESVLSIARAGNLVVVKALAGSGGTAGSVLDRLRLPGVLGCVAGDDTLLIVAETDGAAAATVAALNDIVGE
jgi:transcriptional regulator of arginine metabolism